MATSIKILIFGDIVGKLGRTLVETIMPVWRDEFKPDMVIGNVENLAHGKGITTKSLKQMHDAGIQVFTGGNHVWKKTDPGAEEIRGQYRLALPANDSRTIEPLRWQMIPVRGQDFLVINVLGQAYMADEVGNPFIAFDEIYERNNKPQFVIVDVHAEFTSEKVAFGRYVDGRASVVFGTHTHIATRDERILSQGTGYITDVGMTGSDDSVLGVTYEVIIKRFLGQGKETFTYPETGPGIVNALLCEIDAASGRTLNIRHLTKTMTIN